MCIPAAFGAGIGAYDGAVREYKVCKPVPNGTYEDIAGRLLVRTGCIAIGGVLGAIAMVGHPIGMTRYWLNASNPSLVYYWPRRHWLYLHD
jgi:hypothetical protein